MARLPHVALGAVVAGGAGGGGGSRGWPGSRAVTSLSMHHPQPLLLTTSALSMQVSQEASVWQNSSSFCHSSSRDSFLRERPASATRARQSSHSARCIGGARSSAALRDSGLTQRPAPPRPSRAPRGAAPASVPGRRVVGPQYSTARSLASLRRVLVLLCTGCSDLGSYSVLVARNSSKAKGSLARYSRMYSNVWTRSTSSNSEQRRMKRPSWRNERPSGRPLPARRMLHGW